MLPVFLFSQNKIIDSLQGLLKTEKRDSIRSLIFIDLAFNFSGYDTVKALRSLADANRINKMNDWDYNRGYYYQSYSNYVYERGLYNKSFAVGRFRYLFYKKGEKAMTRPLRDAASFQIAETIMGKGATFGAMENSEEAIKKYHESLQLFEATTHPLKNKKNRLGV